MAVTERQAEALKQHRRETRREIWLPLLGGILLVVLLVGIAAILPRRIQPSLIADVMGTLFLLCPAAICLFPIYMLLMVAAVGMNRVHKGSTKLLGRLENLSEVVMRRTYDVTDRMAQASITVNSSLAPLDRKVFSVFDRPEDKQLPPGGDGSTS